MYQTPDGVNACDIMHVVDSHVARQAAELVARGFSVCKPDPGTKRPSYEKWTTGSLAPEEFGPNDQLGIICGPLSNGGLFGYSLVSIDLDSADAVRRGDEFLPHTHMTDGRPSKPRAHRYYLVPHASIPAWAHSRAPQSSRAAIKRAGHPGPFKKRFTHRGTRECVLDFLGTGGQCVVPPSLHDSGERRTWDGAGGTKLRPAVVDFMRLWQATCDLATACGAAHGGTGAANSSPPTVRVKKTISHEVRPGGVDCPAEGAVPSVEEMRTVRQSVREQLGDELSECVLRSLPKGVGQRDAAIFSFAQQLINRIDGTEPELERVFAQWWRVAVFAVGTKDYTSSLEAFKRAWANAELAVYDTLVKRCSREAAGGCGPAELRLLAAMRAKQRAVGWGCDFFYSERDAATDVGCSRTKVRKMLAGLIANGKVIVTQKGTPSATRRDTTTHYRLVVRRRLPAE